MGNNSSIRRLNLIQILLFPFPLNHPYSCKEIKIESLNNIKVTNIVAKVNVNYILQYVLLINCPNGSFHFDDCLAEEIAEIKYV